jgi:hypothetical protein
LISPPNDPNSEQLGRITHTKQCILEEELDQKFHRKVLAFEGRKT